MLTWDCLPPEHAQVNSLNLQPALSAQTLGVEVGAPYQVGRPFISQNASAGVSAAAFDTRVPQGLGSYSAAAALPEGATL